MTDQTGTMYPVLPEDTERDLWRDAYRIAYIGAANPRAVVGTMGKWMTTLQQDHRYGTDQLKSHPALRNMAGQLSFLFGQGLGQTQTDLEILAAKTQEYGFGTS